MMTENRTALLLVVLCVSSATFIIIGMRLLFAPETHAKSFRKTRAVIVSRSIRDGGFSPLLEFRNGEKTVRTSPVLRMSDGPGCQVGDEMDILFCPKRILFIPVHTVIRDDDGVSLRRISRFYRLSGMGMFLIGCLFLIPIIILLQKR